MKASYHCASFNVPKDAQTLQQTQNKSCDSPRLNRPKLCNSWYSCQTLQLQQVQAADPSPAIPISNLGKCASGRRRVSYKALLTAMAQVTVVDMSNLQHGNLNRSGQLNLSPSLVRSRCGGSRNMLTCMKWALCKRFFGGSLSLTKECLIKGCLNSTEIPKAGIPTQGIPKSGVPKTGIPKTGKTHTGTLPETEISKARVSEVRDPKTGIPKARIPKLGIPTMGRFSSGPP